MAGTGRRRQGTSRHRSARFAAAAAPAIAAAGATKPGRAPQPRNAPASAPPTAMTVARRRLGEVRSRRVHARSAPWPMSRPVPGTTTVALNTKSSGLTVRTTSTPRNHPPRPRAEAAASVGRAGEQAERRQPGRRSGDGHADEEPGERGHAQRDLGERDRPAVEPRTVDLAGVEERGQQVLARFGPFPEVGRVTRPGQVSRSRLRRRRAGFRRPWSAWCGTRRCPGCPAGPWPRRTVRPTGSRSRRCPGSIPDRRPRRSSAPPPGRRSWNDANSPQTIDSGRVTSASTDIAHSAPGSRLR